MGFVRRLLLLVQRLLRRWLAREGRFDRPEYAGPFVGETLERLERMTQDFRVKGQPVDVRVTEVDVRSAASMQVIDVSLLAQRAGEDLHVPTELRWRPSPGAPETIQLAQTFYYTFTSEISVDDNFKGLTDYIEQRFGMGMDMSAGEPA